MNTVTEIIEAYATQPVMTNATLGSLGLDSLDVVAMTLDIEELEGRGTWSISTEQWTVNTRVGTVLSDVAEMRAQH